LKLEFLKSGKTNISSTSRSQHSPAPHNPPFLGETHLCKIIHAMLLLFVSKVRFN